MKDFFKNLFVDINTWKYIAVMSLIWVLVDYFSAEFLLSEDMYRKSLNITDEASFNKTVRKAKSSAIFFSFLSPVMLLVKLLISATAIYVAIYVNDIKSQFNAVFRVVAISFGIFIIPLLVKFLWFMLFDLDYSLEEYRRFNFGSLIFIYAPQSDPYWFRALLELITIFDLFYWLLISYGLNICLNFQYKKIFSLVLFSHLTVSILGFLVKVYWHMSIVGA